MKPARTKVETTTKLKSIASPDDDVPMDVDEEDIKSENAIPPENE